MSSYLPFVMFTAIGFAFVWVTLLVARFLRPSAPNPDKLETYECGPLPIGDAWRQFNMHYYLFALLYVVFDVEAAFLFPWALAFGHYLGMPRPRTMASYAFAEMVIFVALLVVGWVYAFRRKAMEWE